MSEWLEKFEELLDEVISNGSGYDFEEFKYQVVKRMEEVE